MTTMNNGSTIKLSIVIRCRNEAKALRNVLAALKAQRCDFGWEVLVVDNESKDDTRQLATEFGARVVPITSRAFTYGRAINLGVSQSAGDLVMLLSAHSLPIGSYFLAGAVAPFDDQQVAAARCLAVSSVLQLEGWHQPKDIHYKSAQEQQQAEAGSAWLGEYPTAGCCVLRRSVWEEIKFDEQLEANEDKQWALRVLAKGYKIRCCAEAIWLHTRSYGRIARIRREARQHVALYRITKRAPLSLGRYLWLIVRTFLIAPLVAMRYVAENVAWATSLVSIPWRARYEPEIGSVDDFEEFR